MTEAVFVSKLSPLARYVEENLEEGITIHELIMQFREFECPHATMEELSVSTTYVTWWCRACGYMENKNKP